MSLKIAVFAKCHLMVSHICVCLYCSYLATNYNEFSVTFLSYLNLCNVGSSPQGYKISKSQIICQHDNYIIQLST